MGDEAPFHLDGHLAPVPDEISAVDLAVTGTLPTELTGRYFRNGPNPLPGEPSGHWFTGHGMLHGVRVRDGHAEWYRNRWVRTGKLAGAEMIGEDGTVDRSVGSANTSIISHAGKLLALVESSFPYEVTPELDTVGPCDFSGRLTTGMTAHPKEDPATGELHFFGYGMQPPFLTYHRLSADGELVTSFPVEVPGPTMMHDFAVTENHVIWLDLPVTFDLDLVGHGRMPYQWSDSYGARIGVMAKDGGPVRWFDVEPCYVFHVGNAREDAAGRVVLDAVRYDRSAWQAIWPNLGSENIVEDAAAAGTSRLYRWTLDPATGTVREQQIDDRPVEFPTVNDAHVGRANRYLYAVSDDTIVKYDTDSGHAETHHLGTGWHAGEAVFVPAADARNEDDGWLMSIVTHSDPSVASELKVLDASDLTSKPVASVHLPRRVPAGFHGSWIADGEQAR